ncbi:MAG: DHH family phosphoesterase [Desulfobacterales bacterium]|nr:DHH family phosphoesterase [Desulfobacterales bacterium]
MGLDDRIAATAKSLASFLRNPPERTDRALPGSGTGSGASGGSRAGTGGAEGSPEGGSAGDFPGSLWPWARGYPPWPFSCSWSGRGRARRNRERTREETGGRRGMNLDDLASLLRTGDSYILTSHEAPDGDGLGAMYALCRALRKLGKRVTALLSEPVSPKYRFLDSQGVFQVVDTPETADLDLASSLLVVLDTNDAHYAGRIADVFLDGMRGYLLIDHHESRGLDVAGHFLDSDASSTCEIIFELIRRLGVPLDPDMVVALFTGHRLRHRFLRLPQDRGKHLRLCPGTGPGGGPALLRA